MSDSVTLLKLDTVGAYFNDSVMYPMTGGTALSFSHTYHELTNSVVRPRLNESTIDPDLIRGAHDLEASQLQLYKNWGGLELSYRADQIEDEVSKDPKEILSKYLNYYPTTLSVVAEN